MPWNRAPDGSLRIARRELVLGNVPFGRIDDGSANMAINGLPAGASIVVWNGTGAGDTGGDWAASGAGVESAAAAHSGTNGWDSQLQGANQTTVFDNGSEIDVAGTYDTISFWLQPKAYPNNATLQMQWTNAATTVIGATLNVEDYVVNMDLDVWQKVTVPISDFNLGANVQRFVVKYQKGNQQHWIDDIELQSSGGAGPYTFRVQANAGEALHASMLVVLLSGNEVGWNSTGFGSGPFLTNGLLVRQRRLSTGETLWSLNAKDNIDLFGRYHPQESFTFADGKLLVGFMIKPGKNADVVVTDDDVLEYIVRDDLSALDNMRAFYHFGEEDLTP